MERLRDLNERFRDASTAYRAAKNEITAAARRAFRTDQFAKPLLDDKSDKLELLGYRSESDIRRYEESIKYAGSAYLYSMLDVVYAVYPDAEPTNERRVKTMVSSLNAISNYMKFGKDEDLVLEIERVMESATLQGSLRRDASAATRDGSAALAVGLLDRVSARISSMEKRIPESGRQNREVAYGAIVKKAGDCFEFLNEVRIIARMGTKTNIVQRTGKD